ncbi:MAG: transglutaminase family protein [Pseudomonadota bacterium]|nr:transglutaminase family protein [Pseudomonadota bacterium]
MSKIKPAESDLKPYLQTTYFIDCDHSLIQKTARQLTGSLAEAKIMAKTLFLFVRDEIRYNPYCFSASREDYQAHSILARGKGYCIQKAIVLGALCRAVDIPSRLRLANIRNYQVPAKLAEMMKTDIFYCHGYNEIQLDGRWLKATPTFDCFMCERLRINPVNFDGTKDAVFAARTLDGRLHIEYLKQWGPFSDLPFAEIMTTFNDNYGKDMVQQWINAGEQHYD